MGTPGRGQGAADTPPATPASEAVAPAVSPFSPEEIEQIKEATQHLAGGRAGEALFLIEPLVEKYPQRAELLNLQGAAYVRSRRMKDAQEIFEKVLKINPEQPEARFNSTELKFISKDFKGAQEGFSSLLNDIPTMVEPMRHLISYKLIICRLMQDKDADVEDILKEFTFKDDTPAYYMSRVAMYLIRGDREKGVEWLAMAERIYTPPQLEVYMDSLKELDLVPNMEGGGIDLSGAESSGGPAAPVIAPASKP